MEYVDPIKDIKSINKIKEILKRQSQRDLLLFVLGINTGIRVSDLLSLRISDVSDGKEIKEFIYIDDLNNGAESKNSNEQKAYFLNNSVKKELKKYFSQHDFTECDFLFKSKKNNQPITRQQAYRIINSAAKEAGIEGKIGTHTLRKTFGYHAYRKGIAISIIMSIYNHHSSAETLRYLGIERGQKQLIKVDVNL
ncbi:tyrosine-type recombinase/integrase [Cytobacillus firmus]|uniref:tyrosine-type recombinase/integrase n=1 Tax=Cytobacillus firmus TaxID=1399 RepID=UPI00077C7934|nr:tyrosine-type recombinase/integrase [Cytobacillus firmus]MBG9543530.1 integrase [Cytobacillus firmus]MBG9549435.1 integrase [Cytobacillus firmus]MBG9554850.1 integrase [Cytobacillus firmus]MBG9559576.1 integrase [Cytobacillus firmus]MBG9577298.1 integrase [Cytobacillus firmus]